MHQVIVSCKFGADGCLAELIIIWEVLFWYYHTTFWTFN